MVSSRGIFERQEKKLVNAQEGKTQALRQWKFTAKDTIDSELVLSYILEAIENSKAGKKIKPKPKKELDIPKLLKNEFKKNKAFNNSFKKLTPGKQREYAEYISTAKREATQISRLEKIAPMIKEGKGLHDKYKNC